MCNVRFPTREKTNQVTVFKPCRVRISLPRLLAGALATGLLAATGPGSAGQYQSHDSIRDAARDHVWEHADGFPVPPQVTVGRLDSRLKLPGCTGALEAFTPPGRKRTGRTTVGVRCNGAKPWSLYVPVTVSVMGEVVVATRDLMRGQMISASDIELAERDLTQLHSGYLSTLDLAVGKRVKRTIRQGRIVKPIQIAAPTLIKKGAEVTIKASSDRIQITTKGKALGSGGIGERIRVRNLRSSKVVEATVVNAGTVQVDL